MTSFMNFPRLRNPRYNRNLNEVRPSCVTHTQPFSISSKKATVKLINSHRSCLELLNCIGRARIVTFKKGIRYNTIPKNSNLDDFQTV